MQQPNQPGRTTNVTDATGSVTNTHNSSSVSNSTEVITDQSIRKNTTIFQANNSQFPYIVLVVIVALVIVFALWLKYSSDGAIAGGAEPTATSTAVTEQSATMPTVLPSETPSLTPTAIAVLSPASEQNQDVAPSVTDVPNLAVPEQTIEALPGLTPTAVATSLASPAGESAKSTRQSAEAAPTATLIAMDTATVMPLPTETPAQLATETPAVIPTNTPTNTPANTPLPVVNAAPASTAVPMPTFAPTIPTALNGTIRITAEGFGMAPANENNPAMRRRFAILAATVDAKRNLAAWANGETIEAVTIVTEGVVVSDEILISVRALLKNVNVISETYDDTTRIATVVAELLLPLPLP